MANRIRWTDEQYLVIAARTIQLRNTRYDSLADAIVQAQKELLDERLWRISSHETQYARLGPQFHRLIKAMRNDLDSAIQQIIDIYTAKYRKEDPPAQTVEAPQTAEPAEEKPSVEDQVTDSPPASLTGVGAILEQALLKAMQPVVDQFLESLRSDVRQALTNVQQHYTAQVEKKLQTIVQQEMGSLTPHQEVVPRPKHNPAMIEVVPSASPKYRILVFHVLESQMAVIRESLRTKLTMHRVELLAIDTKAELFKRHTRDSFVIYLPKFSNHLPPNYEREYVRKVLVANGMTQVKDHIMDILSGTYDF